jgi:oligoribonuclease NrnB/cAMP/cGMP phosphodiesterase (DHH superfamily)
MRALSKPEIILTHESDLDGLFSGLLLRKLARKLFNEDVPLAAYNYQNWKSREMREEAAWVCDLSFEPRLDKPGWVIIDHHARTADPKSALLIHDLSKSAGSLCYELCQEHGLGSPALDRLARLNNIADLFLDDDPDFALASDYANLVKSYQFWNLMAVLGGKAESLLDHPLLEVMAVKRRVEDPIGYEWCARNIERLSPAAGYLPTVIGNNNLIAHQLLERKATPFPVLVTLFKKANNTVVASLRSRNGEALGLAEQLQGGGHPNAAGATLPRSVRSVDDAIRHLKQTWNPPPAKEQALNSLGALLDSIKTA